MDYPTPSPNLLCDSFHGPCTSRKLCTIEKNLVITLKVHVMVSVTSYIQHPPSTTGKFRVGIDIDIMANIPWSQKVIQREENVPMCEKSPKSERDRRN